ncbi:dihydroneopterin aldolase [Bacillus sp. ISL-47]|uniref:dihydroneopterin aldolase n=1 Tax=Bacillus sp. ISL-47 TaxID=2819130 RepID=UPI001BECE8BC|nr:dihydroneopterin aldolase [Bacillus sp. ISL-47]MBT2688740.1 dihydroneopterin aldolase [Bacillus sp. ISL-47]MBT2709563.1 dihydroneopterin aldolase [Pseudomonas sp. ISL-84]
MDKIYVSQMEFYGYHGVFPEETRLGQRFVVDLIVETDLKKAGETDDLDDSINYGELYTVCKEVVEGKPYKLVEAVAEKLAGDLLERFPPISQLTVKVIKPDPPIPGHYKSVAVEITRGR